MEQSDLVVLTAIFLATVLRRQTYQQVRFGILLLTGIHFCMPRDLSG